MPPMAKAIVLLLCSILSSADVYFAPVFGNRMVLQRDVKAAVFGGGANPGDTLSVDLLSDAPESTTESYKTVARSDGTWKVLMDPKKAGGSYALSVRGSSGDPAQLTGATFGDVWFCSGQSNMELGLEFTIQRNASYAAARAGRSESIRLFQLAHNPAEAPQWVITNSSEAIEMAWTSPKDADANGTLPGFSAACYYFGEALTDRMRDEGGVVPVGLIESAFGGTMIESWLDAETQLVCSNITCTSLQPAAYNRSSKAACLAAPGPSKSAGPNGFLWHGMVAPFVNMTVRGWLWYQGENNLPYHAGNVMAKSGYACLLQELIGAWRTAWSAEPGTTAPLAPFGIVLLADSTDEGWGSNVPQMHWAQTGNAGVVPNPGLPGAFVATAHDLADPWDDGCMDDSAGACCVDTGRPVDARCNAKHRGWLVQTGQYPGVSEPVTPSRGVTIHPRIKRQVGERLARAAWALAYGHDDVAWTGPVLSGCAVEANGTQLRLRFNETLLQGDSVAVSEYNQTEMASVTWVLVNASVPSDAAANYVYVNRQEWWGDSNAWVNVNIVPAGDGSRDVIAALPPGVAGHVAAVQYGHLSPKGHPQSGHDKICCGNRDFQVDPCAPESCPIASREAKLPAMPFHAAIVDGKCKCFAPQTCDEL